MQSCHRAGVAEREEDLGQPRDLEEEHVPAARELARVLAQVLRHDGGMRAVHDGEPPRALGTVHGELPRDGAAPVVPDDGRVARAEGVDQAVHVGDQLGIA